MVRHFSILSVIEIPGRTKSLERFNFLFSTFTFSLIHSQIKVLHHRTHNKLTKCQVKSNSIIASITNRNSPQGGFMQCNVLLKIKPVVPDLFGLWPLTKKLCVFSDFYQLSAGPLKSDSHSKVLRQFHLKYCSRHKEVKLSHISHIRKEQMLEKSPKRKNKNLCILFVQPSLIISQLTRFILWLFGVAPTPTRLNSLTSYKAVKTTCASYNSVMLLIYRTVLQLHNLMIHQ